MLVAVSEKNCKFLVKQTLSKQAETETCILILQKQNYSSWISESLFYYCPL
jgi:hypothetical protein